MTEIPRLSISAFIRRSGDVELPVIVTRDGEDLFAVVSLAMLDRSIPSVPPVPTRTWPPVEVPVDFARDT